MDEYQLEKALEVLAQLQALDYVSTTTANSIETVTRGLDLCQNVFKDNDTPLLDNEGESSIDEIAASIWRSTIDDVNRLTVQVEEETQSRPGCLPLEQRGCELMGLVLNLRYAVMENYFLYEMRLRKKPEGG